MNFYFSDPNTLDLGGPAEKQRNNVKSIRILKECQNTNRPATAEEQADLSRYVGWGDSAVLKGLADPEISAMLSSDEMRAARGSSLNAHYTALPVIGAIWSTLLHMGLGWLPKIRSIDPSAGVGHFASLTPESIRSKTDWIEVELDNLTAGILGLLHPNNRVRNQGFETMNLPSGWFDLAVSNVPFGNYGVVSKAVPAFAKESIHDFFFANTVALLRTGGVMAYITSRFTLDKKNSQTRVWLSRHMDLLAAVRLPNTAFKANAGTEVVTDILFLQKRASEQVTPPLWTELKQLYRSSGSYAREPIYYSQYYADHPEMVLGRVTTNGSMYQSDGYNVEPDGRNLAEAIRSALVNAIPENCMVVDEPVADEDSAPIIITTAAKGRTPDAERRLAAMQEIYTLAKNLLAAEMRGTSIFETSELRHKLNQAYDSFTVFYGPINKPINAKLLDGSVEGPFLKALEQYDRISATARKAGIFTGPLVRSSKQIETTTPADALLVCLDRLGRVDIESIAAACGLPAQETINQLGDLVYQEPGTGKWLTADEYFSGNVREKLTAAKAAAALDAAFERNVLALEAAQPAPLKPTEIRAPMGAGWVPTEIVHNFLLHLLEAGSFKVNYIPALAHWEVECWDYWRIPTGLMQGRWGTSRMSALDLVRDGLNAKIPVVYDEVDDGNGGEKAIVNTTETVAAQMKLVEIKAEWESWLWRDPERALELAGIYNERYNAHRVRHYNGNHLSTPGLNLAITPRSTQKNVVWRILQNQSAFVAHEVGTGKTLAGIMAAMEARRLRLVRKTVVVVPNHLTAQWHAQALWAYPNANILVATAADLAKGKRGEFLSRIATNDWDMVIVPISSFKLLPVKPETMANFFQEQINQLEDYLAELKAGESYSKATKEIEKALKRFRTKLENLSEMAKDAVGTITWEELGVGMLIVDEIQCLPCESRVCTNMGLLPIGEIVEKRLPVLVKSVDLSTNQVEWRPVTGWFNNSQSAPMVRVKHEKGSFECTANHKVWTEENGYVEAGKLTRFHTLKNLPDVQQRIHAEQQRKTGTIASSLFPGMSEKRRTQDSDKKLRTMWRGIHIPVHRKTQQRQKAILWKRMCSNMAQCATRTNSQDGGVSSPHVGSINSSMQGKTITSSLASYEDTQSNSKPRMQKEAFSFNVGKNFSRSRWKRYANQAARNSCIGAKSANGVSNPNSAGSGPVQISSSMLQGRHRRPISKTCHRNRWKKPSVEEMAVFGSSKDRGIERSRVVRVTFLESEGGFRSAICSGRDQRVYCLEVEGTHNFFAEGILVSNCFKNLYFPTKMTRIAGLTNSDSQRAFDMFIKVRHTLGAGGKVVGMTGTPVTNTIAEMYTMQRYFQMDTLEKLGLSHFDAWANQFALAEPGLEMTPDGAGFRMNVRFRKFVNVPELMTIWAQVADTKRIDASSGIERPDLYSGRPVKVVSDGGDPLSEYVGRLAERAERIHSGLVEPTEDNMLKVAGDGRKAALDMSLVVPTRPGTPMPKIDALVDLVAEVYKATAPTSGTQLIFCDLATPKAKS